MNGPASFRKLHRKVVVGSLLMLACVLPSRPSGRSAAAAGSSATGDTGCRGVQIPPGGDVQATIAASPEGATFCFQPGIYRLERPLEPKAKQRLIGTQGVVLNGAKLITGFVAEGPNFVA